MKSRAPAYNELVSRQLQKATNDLRNLQQLLVLEGINPRVLMDFRETVDGVRHTAWAVQEWMELRDKQEDIGPVLASLTEHRIRIATHLNNDLAIGFENGEVNSQAKGLSPLQKATEKLLAAMAQCLTKSKPEGGRS
jgi:hypothetical protein